jgi:hypothetical protein
MQAGCEYLKLWQVNRPDMCPNKQLIIKSSDGVDVFVAADLEKLRRYPSCAHTSS